MRIGLCCVALTACLLSLTCVVVVPPASAATMEIVASTPELADIAKVIGGEVVDVYSIAKPNQDYHMIEPRPSDVARISRAYVVLKVGMDLDMWMDALINASGNSQVMPGGAGFVDCSAGITKLQVPTESITGASGDIHVQGNPHYFYDPYNAEIIAHNIVHGLNTVYPAGREYFNYRADWYIHEIDRLLRGWMKDLAPYQGGQVVTYHESAVYFLKRFGLGQFGTLEVRPGIPPSAAHVQNLIGAMKANGVRAIAVESIYPRQYPDMVARETGAREVIVPYSVGSMGTSSYFELIGKWVAKYKEALGG